MASHDPPSDALDGDELVAYLDGELSAEESRRLEERLAVDESLRERLRDLDRAWDALDALPPATVRDDFTRTTIEMVSVAAEKDLSERKAVATAGNRKRGLLAGAAVLAAAAIGFAAMRALPDENQRLVSDLPVIMQVDLLSQIPDVDFLRKLPTVIPVEQLSVDDERLERDVARVTQVSSASPPARGTEIERFTAEDKAALAAQAERFWERSEADQAHLRSLQREIAGAADSAELQTTLAAYGQWLERRGSGVKAELRSNQLDGDQRLRRIAELVKEDDRRAARKLSPEDAKALREEMFAIAAERKPPWVDAERRDADPDNKGRKNRWAFVIVHHELRNKESYGRMRDRLVGVLSPAAQEHLAKMRSEHEQGRTLWKWMWDAMRPERGPEALERFFAEDLDNDQRARLLNLPPGEMEAELERLYFADQFGERGREWLGSLGGPPPDWGRGRGGRGPGQRERGPREEDRPGPRRNGFDPGERGPEGAPDRGRAGRPPERGPFDERERRPPEEQGREEPSRLEPSREEPGRGEPGRGGQSRGEQGPENPEPRNQAPEN